MASQESIVELFDSFVSASTLRALLTAHKKILNKLDLKPCKFSSFFPAYKKGVCPTSKHGDYWKASSILTKIERKASCPVYNVSRGKNNALKGKNVLVIGGGPCGLRTAIEMQFLGADHVVIVEKRDRFSRNNVLHLWPFVIEDLKSLGAKKFYGKFCAGSIDHASIRQLQLILLKVALITGCEFHENISFEELCPRYLLPVTKNGRQQVSDSSQISSPVGSKCCGVSLQHQDPSQTTEECSCCCHEHESGFDMWGNPSSSGHSSSMTCGAVAHFSFTTTPSVLSSSFLSSSTPSASQSNLSQPKQLHVNGQSSNQYSQDLNRLRKRLNGYRFEILIGADGRRNTLSDNFPRKEFRGHKLAIAITANFINDHTLREAQIPEISGISFIYNQQLFRQLEYETGIDLENICYYKDDTHYFVMTAKKSSLLVRKVLKRDCQDTRALLAPENVNRQELLKYARDAASWTTGTGIEANQSSEGSLSNASNSKNPKRYEFRFALNHYGEADVAMFDFTSMYAAENACKIKRLTPNCNKCSGIPDSSSTSCLDGKENAKTSEEKKLLEPLLLMALVGDSLLEPFWPMGTGLARGFLSALDTAWMARQWTIRRAVHERNLQGALLHEARGIPDGQDDNHYHSSNHPTTKGKQSSGSGGRGSPTKAAYRRSDVNEEDELLQVLAERESIYRLLAQTKSENLNQNFGSYTLNPATRYPNLNPHTMLPHQVRHLLGDDYDPPNPNASFTDRNAAAQRERKNAQTKRLRRATVAITSSVNPRDYSSDAYAKRLEEEESLPSKREHDSNRYHESFAGRNLSPLLTRRFLSRKDSFEDSLQEFESEYQRHAEFNQLQRSATSSRVPLRATRNNSFKESIERSNSNNAVIFSPSASNLASLERNRLRDIQMCLKQRRQHLEKMTSSGAVEPEAREILARNRHSNNLHPIESIQSLRDPTNLDDVNPTRNFSLAKSFTANLGDNHNDNEFSRRRAVVSKSLYGGSSSTSSETHSQSSGSRSPREFNPKDEAYMLRKLQVKAARSLTGSVYDYQKDRDQLKRNQDLMSTSYPGGSSSEMNIRQGKPRINFADRVKDLEVKLYQASGLLNEHRLSVDSKHDPHGRQLRSSEIYGPQVATLQELLAQQFKQNETTPKTKSVKVGKITTDDWNVKVWEEKVKSPHVPSSPSKSLSPRPEKALEVFRDRLNKMEHKLTDEERAIFDGDSELLKNLLAKKSKDARTVLASVKDSRRNDFVSLMKNELSARTISPKTIPSKGPLRSETARNFLMCDDDDDVTDESHNSKSKDSLNMSKGRGLEHSSSTSAVWPKSSLCVRCGIVVPTMDRILLSGVVLHRTCLTCSRCGVTLRLSEVRAQQSSTSSSTSFTKDGNSNMAEAKGSSMNYFCVLCSNLNSKQTVEERIREKQKWKEQFISSSSGVDLRQYLKDPKEKEREEQQKQAEAARAAQNANERRKSFDEETLTESMAIGLESSKHDTSSETSSMISERIEYENMSCSDELFDDDELTKLLNLDSDLDTDVEESDESDDHDADDDEEDEKTEGNQHEEEKDEEESDTTPSSDWSPDSDSTENDFDSDELDQSCFSAKSDLRDHKSATKAAVCSLGLPNKEHDPSNSTTTDSQGSASEGTAESRKGNRRSSKKYQNFEGTRKHIRKEQQQKAPTRRQDSVPEIVVVSEPDDGPKKSTDDSTHSDDDSPRNMDQSDASELLKSSTLTSLGICGATDSKAYLAESESLEDDDFDDEDKTLEEHGPSGGRDSLQSSLLAK